MAKEKETEIPEEEQVDRRDGSLGRRESDNDIVEFDTEDDLRVNFAMAALSAMSIPTLSTSSSDDGTRADIARSAWQLADAMMAAR